jgi:uncharacterized protein YkwD
MRRSWVVLFLVLAACPSSRPPRATASRAATADPAPAAPVMMAPPPPVLSAGMALERSDADAEGMAYEPPILVAHNRVRAEHCAPPLVWSDALAAEAAAWAAHLSSKGCAFKHSSSEHGENLAAGTTGSIDDDAVVAMWAAEEEHYDFRNPAFSMRSGHFTQVVWKDTMAVGCAQVTCGRLDTWVCNYDPAGNVEGDFALNVAPRGCR